MSLFIASLNSGSNGNCYYIGNNEEAVLVDAGISCREVEKRMKGLDLDISRLKAIFITHEHTDHVSGLRSLLKKYRLPVYITRATCRGTGFLSEIDLISSFSAFEPVQIGTLAVTAFPKRHDAADPHSMVVRCGEVTVGVFTDIGAACKNVISYFKQCHAVFLEANYDEQLLANGRYPFFLKQRITSGKGHLSNGQALQLFLDHKPSFMTHVLLSHLSKENNDPAIASDLFNRHANGVAIVHAPRDKATAVYYITARAAGGPYMPESLLSSTNRKATKHQFQLRLF